MNTITKTQQAKQLPRRIDFELAAYMASDDRIALWQIISTVLPIIAISIALGITTQSLSAQTLALSAALFVLLVLFLSRSFSLMHDCGHQSLFRSKSANRIAAFSLSLIHGMPHHPWSRGHAFHHKHNGNWDRYRGPSALITRQKFDQKTDSSKRLYKTLRHPLLLFPGGFFYLIVKPRATLLLGLFEFSLHSIRGCLKDIGAGQHPDFGAIAASHKSSFFYTKGEAIDTTLNTICVALLWWWAGSAIGYVHFWVLYFFVMSTSAALMIAVFFIQHNFPGSYASSEEDWSYFKGALEGSSFLQMPALLNWFTADIAYHHIHHLSERIPNYRLSQCHQANLHLLDGVRRLRLSEISTCFSLILWDRDKLELTTTTAG
ncbi:fatty acid desaturase [Synechococcus sp. MIT S9452]|uniref:fatty acid desaturase n=1 Tax=Synechococcus sp. MIT S9452 TaxID=3082546 RepID=UPI0039A77458